MMRYEQKKVEPDITVIVLNGRMIGGLELTRLEQTVDDILAKGQRKVVFDMSAVDYLDSSALAVIISCVSKARSAGGTLRVAGVTDRVMRIFKMTRVDSTL